MRRSILVCTALMMVVMLLIGGGTYAYYTDKATNSNNTFSAGTVKVNINRSYGDPIPGPMFYTCKDDGYFPPEYTRPNPPYATGLWHPGKELSRQLNVANAGTLPFEISGFSATLNENELGVSIAQEFSDNMEIKILISGPPDPNGYPSLYTLYDSSLTNLLNSEQPVDQALRAYTYLWPGANFPLTFCVKMKETAGNNLQGIVPLVDFKIYVEQAH